MSLLICLDPGHVRDYNRGAFNKYYEGNKMFDLALMLQEEIRKYKGMDAIVTRTSLDDNPALHKRAQMAKDAGARCFLSLHTNACNYENVNRVSIYRSQAMPNSEKLAWKLMDAIYDTVSADVPTAKENIIRTRLNDYGTDWYGVLRNSTGGSVKESFLVEHIYHTNYKQSEWMYNDINVRKLAIAEAKALAMYYGYIGTYSGDSTIEVEKPKEEATSYIKYTVKTGDSWWSIAAKQMGSGLKMNELIAFNEKTANTILHPMDVIKIPITEEISYKSYTVKSGDSWCSIAKNQMSNGSEYKRLANFNNMSSDDIINPGDIIKIPC